MPGSSCSVTPPRMCRYLCVTEDALDIGRVAFGSALPWSGCQTAAAGAQHKSGRTGGSRCLSELVLRAAEAGRCWDPGGSRELALALSHPRVRRPVCLPTASSSCWFRLALCQGGPFPGRCSASGVPLSTKGHGQGPGASPSQDSPRTTCQSDGPSQALKPGPSDPGMGGL